MTYIVTGTNRENLVKRVNAVKEVIDENNKINKLNGWILINEETTASIVNKAIKKRLSDNQEILETIISFREIPVYSKNYHGTPCLAKTV